MLPRGILWWSRKEKNGHQVADPSYAEESEFRVSGFAFSDTLRR